MATKTQTKKTEKTSDNQKLGWATLLDNVAQQVLDAVEAAKTDPSKAQKWVKNWNSASYEVRNPTKPSCEQTLSGVNHFTVFCLSMLAGKRGLVASWKQWEAFFEKTIKENEGQLIEAGLMPTTRFNALPRTGIGLLRPQMVPFEKKKADGTVETVFFIKFYPYSAHLLDDLLPEYIAVYDFLFPQEKVNLVERDKSNQAALDFAAELWSTHPPIHFGGNRAFYSPTLNHIQMPNLDTFNSLGDGLGTLVHELAHATGHKTIFDRFNENSRAVEEEVAELTAMTVGVLVLSQYAGWFDADNSLAYLVAWATRAKGDLSDALKKAASQTSQILKFWASGSKLLKEVMDEAE